MIKALGGKLIEVGKWGRFTGRVTGLIFKKGIVRREFVEQMYQVGTRSLPITIVAGIFVGAILALQIDLQLKDFGGQIFLGGISTSTTLRNLGPLLIAFLLAGRVGAFTSAELGTMAITEQLNALKCLGLDPLKIIVAPRFLAVILSSFCLLILGLGLTVLGGTLVSSILLNVNPLQFISRIPQFVTAESILMSLTKSFIFGVVIGSIACFLGYHTVGGAEDVGRTVRKTAVLTLLLIILTDFGVTLLADSLTKIIGANL